MQLTKRRLLALGAATTAGIAITTTSKPVRGNIKLTDLSIPDKTAGVTSDVADVKLATTFQYSFQSNTPLDVCVFHLRVGTTTNDLQQITGIRYSGIGESGSGTETLGGSILSHPNLSASMFDPPTGESTSQQIHVELRMQLEKNNTVEHTATAQASPTITVNDETVIVDSSLEGSGGATVVA